MFQVIVMLSDGSEALAIAANEAHRDQLVDHHIRVMARETDQGGAVTVVAVGVRELAL